MSQDDYFDDDERAEMGYPPSNMFDTTEHDAYGNRIIPGTMNRPMMANDGKKKHNRWDPTIRWGDEVYLDLPTGGTDAVTKDLLNTKFGKSLGQTVKLHFHAEVVEVTGANPEVFMTAVELLIGCGSQTTTIQKTFFAFPQNNRALDVDWEYPIQNIRGRVLARGNSVRVRCSIWLVPLVGATDEVGGE